jgi:hypothetical protein
MGGVGKRIAVQRAQSASAKVKMDGMTPKETCLRLFFFVETVQPILLRRGVYRVQ